MDKFSTSYLRGEACLPLFQLDLDSRRKVRIPFVEIKVKLFLFPNKRYKALNGDKCQRLDGAIHWIAVFSSPCKNAQKALTLQICTWQLIELLKQLVSNLWIKGLHNQLVLGLLTTCSRLVIIKPR